MNDEHVCKGPNRKLGTLSHLSIFTAIMRGQCCDLDGRDGATMGVHAWTLGTTHSACGLSGCLNGMVRIGMHLAYWVRGHPPYRIRAHRYERA